MYQKGLQILKSRIGIKSNREKILPSLPFPIEVKSLLTDFHQVYEIPYSEGMDGYVFVEDSPGKPVYEFSREKASFKGPFLELSNEASDLRFSLWGNQGYLYRYTLYLLEKKHSIYNFHACALFHEEREALYLIIGGAGSGKTVFLLSGLLEGLKLFSTETVHLKIDGDELIWYLGSLVDNVRLGTLLYDFPQFKEGFTFAKTNLVWEKKIALDLSQYKVNFTELKNPKSVYILFPRVEEGRKGFVINPVQEKRKAEAALFNNISQKLAETFILYDKIPVLGLDDEDMANQRIRQVNNLLQHRAVKQIATILTNPNDCWGNLLNSF